MSPTNQLSINSGVVKLSPGASFPLPLPAVRTTCWPEGEGGGYSGMSEVHDDNISLFPKQELPGIFFFFFFELLGF